VNIKLYFSFLLEFVKHYHHAIGDSIISMISTLVQRVKTELHSCHEKGEKTNMTINKCWNVIRTVVELNSFMPLFYNEIENALKPLFEYMVNPD